MQMRLWSTVLLVGGLGIAPSLCIAQSAHGQRPPAGRTSSGVDSASRPPSTGGDNASIPIYQLYPTQNIYTFVLLDSRDGTAWQVQFAMGDAVAIRHVINGESLNGSSAARSGRYALTPTQNMYTFMLLDHDSGRLWQLQWNLDADKRFINELP
jgi:hypothetical protein